MNVIAEMAATVRSCFMVSSFPEKMRLSGSQPGEATLEPLIADAVCAVRNTAPARYSLARILLPYPMGVSCRSKMTLSVRGMPYGACAMPTQAIDRSLLKARDNELKSEPQARKPLAIIATGEVRFTWDLFCHSTMRSR